MTHTDETQWNVNISVKPRCTRSALQARFTRSLQCRTVKQTIRQKVLVPLLLERTWSLGRPSHSSAFFFQDIALIPFWFCLVARFGWNRYCSESRTVWARLLAFADFPFRTYIAMSLSFQIILSHSCTFVSVSIDFLNWSNKNKIYYQQVHTYVF